MASVTNILVKPGAFAFTLFTPVITATEVSSTEPTTLTETTSNTTVTTETVLNPSFYVEGLHVSNSTIAFDMACADETIVFDILTASLINAETYELT